jgi:hypothetical protein
MLQYLLNLADLRYSLDIVNYRLPDLFPPTGISTRLIPLKVSL